MRFDVITLFPEMIESVTEYGVISRAAEQGLIELHCINPRDFATDKHRTVDARPYGGGPGMVMKADVVLSTIRAAKQQAPANKVVYLSPQGKTVDQAMLAEAANETGLILLCGRYEGIDERIIELEVDEEWSIGDYVLSGGELGAMVLIDAITRLLPGALGHEQSAEQDSFSDGLLDCPHYTRPEQLDEQCKPIPAVLKSGNHAEIAKWRRQQTLGRTYQRRPDLLEKLDLSEQDEQLLEEFLRQH
ncbi:MAG: tRNA (guanosine(37)-N1)-methyltransferase TrmD [Thiotrichaceae bacterium]